MTLEQTHQNAPGRITSLSKTAGPSNNLFMRNVFNEQNNGQNVNQNELIQLKQQNQLLRQKIGLGHHLPQSRPAVVNQSNNVDPSYGFMPKSLTSLERRNPNLNNTTKPQTSIIQELRKGNTTELQVKKMDTAVTKGGYSTMETSANGTRFDQRRSIDRTTQNEPDYGSIMSPGSPVKPGRANLAYSGHKQQRTESKQFYERIHTMTAAQNGSQVKRSSSVQKQNYPMEVNTQMSKTAPKGFFKQSQQVAQGADSPLMRPSHK